MATVANASLTSNKSTSATVKPAFLSTFSMAAIGAVVNHSGACEWVLCAKIRANGFNPLAIAWASSIRTSAAAPSLILEELAAVIVPSFLNAGLRLGILLISHLPGCSSISKTISPLRVFTVTGAISSLNEPLVCAASARRTDSAANASCSSRVKLYLSAQSSPKPPIGCLS